MCIIDMKWSAEAKEALAKGNFPEAAELYTNLCDKLADASGNHIHNIPPEGEHFKNARWSVEAPKLFLRMNSQRFVC